VHVEEVWLVRTRLSSSSVEVSARNLKSKFRSLARKNTWWMMPDRRTVVTLLLQRRSHRQPIAVPITGQPRFRPMAYESTKRKLMAEGRD